MKILLDISLTNQKWQQFVCNTEELETLYKIYKISPIVSTILLNRNITALDAISYIAPKLKNLCPDPLSLLNMDKACNILCDHIKKKHSVVILGDYDVDGITSSTLLYKVLSSVHKDINVYIPDRYKEGYGISNIALENLKEQYNPKLLILLDNGSLSYNEIELAKSDNIDVIVIDHHNTDLKPLPCDAFVNPFQLNDESELNYLCTVGLVFLFVIALNNEFIKQNITTYKLELLKFLPLVALGTVCDMVPLKGVNRAFVTQGLEILKNNNINNYIDDLMPLSVLIKHLKATYTLSISTFGFQIGPCINAGSRMGHSKLAFDLLTCNNYEEANILALSLINLNEERKQEEEAIIHSAIEDIKTQPIDDKEIIFVGSNNYAAGIIGIIAGRLKEIYKKPTCVYAIDSNSCIATSSARSVPNIHIGSIVIGAKQANLLIKGGGHSQAAGFSFHTDNIKEIEEYFNKKTIQQINKTGYNRFTVNVDMELIISQITTQLIDDVAELSPFGSNFEEPIFLLRNVVLSKCTIVGENKNNVSVSITGTNKQFIKAFCPKCLPGTLGEQIMKNENKSVNLLVTLYNNFYKGKKYPSAIIKDIGIIQ